MIGRATLAALAVVTVTACAQGAISTDPTAAEVAEAVRLMKMSQAAGYITDYTCTGNTVHVTPRFWTGLTAKSKEGFAIGMARVCHGEASGHYITVIDAQSAKSLASYRGGRFEVF